jgi:hypothetical protein
VDSFRIECNRLQIRINLTKSIVVVHCVALILLSCTYVNVLTAVRFAVRTGVLH